MGQIEIDRKANYDMYCENKTEIYGVGISDFTFDDYESEPERSEVVHTIKLKNQNGKTFYDKLT